MATNTLLTISMITKEAQRILHNSLGFTKGVNRQYDDRFARSGAKIGTSLNLRMPVQYYVSSGANLAAQNHTESNVALSVTTQKHVDVSFTSVEQTMSLDEYSDRILRPAVSRLATEVDKDGLAAANQVYNSVGTPGTTPVANSTINRFIEAGTKLNHFACPDDMRNMIVGPDAQQSALINSIALFNPPSQISSQYRKGSMAGAPVYGFDWAMDQNIESLTLGTRANGAVNGANQTGATITLDGIDANTTLVKGDSFTIANVYAVNPENQQSTGQLMQFVVTTAANADANGDLANLAITPSIIVAGANVANGTVNALPADGAAITYIGAASASAKINLAHHRDAFVLGTADLELPNSGQAHREVMDGISMRVWKDSLISTDSHPCRIDVLYGWKLVRPELACKIYG